MTSLNLISDAWIPVRRIDGSCAVIAPWQVADETLAFPDWPRPDLNIACLELLIGLMFLADPPADADDWEDRQPPDSGRLRDRLAPFAPAFELLGEGPRFMQDLETFERGVRDPNGPDMLFIDSAGGQASRFNSDLMVKRARYPRLEPALAAMALYTLQAHAPEGGRGIRTSMRGGGPILTLVEPKKGLWSMIWANVPYGRPAPREALPWMRPTRTSENNHQVFPSDAHPVEAFFGMPRRLRLVAADGEVRGVVQRPSGTNYAGWEHPLTPHYRMKAGAELLPRHPRAGHFGYRNWLGIVAKSSGAEDDTARRAWVVDHWSDRSGGRVAEILVAGWAMKAMKPRDFVFSRAPLLDLPDEMIDQAEGMVRAAEALAVALRTALTPVLAEGEARESARETFFVETQAAFEARLGELVAGSISDEVARGWLADLRVAAVNIFERLALPGLGERDASDQAAIVQARRSLGAAFAGYGKFGRDAFTALGLTPPEQGRRKGKAA